MSANHAESNPNPTVQIRMSNQNGASSQKKTGTIVVKFTAQEGKHFIVSGGTNGKGLKMKLPLKLKITSDPNDPHSKLKAQLVMPDQEHIGKLTSQDEKRTVLRSDIQYKTERSSHPELNSLAVQVSESGHPCTLIPIEEIPDFFFETATPQDNFHSPYRSVSDFLNSIAEELDSKAVYFTLLDGCLIQEMFCQPKRLHFNFEQTQQLISIVLRYLALSKNNAQGKEPNHLLLHTRLQLRDFAEVLGVQWRKLKEDAYSSNKNILKVLDYIQPKCDGEGSRYNHCFFNLRFDLSDQQLSKVAQAVKYQCRYNHKSFCFLTNYLFNSCKHLQQIGNVCIRQIQDILTSAINRLIQDHPPFTSKQGSEELLQRHPSFRLEKAEYPSKTLPLRNIPREKKVQVIQRFIQYRARDAQKNSGAFARLIKDVCSKTGSNLSAGVKIKSMKKRSAIERVKEKVLDTVSLSHRNQLLLDVNPNLNIDQYTEAQFQQYKHRLNAIFISLEQTIQFGVDDLLRGRCIFPSLDFLNNSCQFLKEEIPLRGYTLLSLRNRLKQKSSDIILHIRMGETVAELQLILEYKLAPNEFSAKLDHLRRALYYNHITHLKLVNQKLTYLFLEQALAYVRDNIKPCSYKDYKEKTNYMQTRLNLERFINILPFKFDRAELDLNQIQLSTLATEIDQFKKIVQTPTSEVVSSRDLLKSNGDFLYQLTKYEQSLKDQTQYCRNIEKKHRELVDHPQNKVLSTQQRLILKSYAGAIYVIGKIHMRNKDYSSAVDCLQRSQKLTQLLGNRDEYVVETLQHLGQIQYRRNNLPKAVEIYTGLLQFQESSTKSSPQQYRQSLLALALIYQHQGNYFEAIRHLQRIISILQKQKGKDHIQLATIYNHIGATHHLQGNLTASLAAYRKSLAIIQREKGQNSFDCASVLANIGLIYEIDYNFYEAAMHYQKAMQICSKHNLKEITYANAAFGLGKCQAQNKNLSKAIDILHKALEYFQKSKGQMYYATLTVIAVAYEGLGEDEKASKYYDKLQSQ